jgi:hypothetical protein
MPRIRRRTLAIAALLAAPVLAMTACAPEPEPAESPAASSSSSSAPTPAASSSVSPAAATASLPSACEDAYSAGMLATLQSETPPLNDPGITLLSTDRAALLELLESVPTLRCTWGPPGPSGLSTNVSILDAGQADDVLAGLRAAGFGCESAGETELCSIEQRGITLDDAEYVRGEVHALRDGVWVATAWINVLPDGYAQDVVDTVLG